MTIDRPRGVLSPADRRYLQNPDEYSDQAAYERRQAITERVREGLNDFSLIVSALDEDSRAEAFAGETVDSLPSVIAFLYLGLTDIEPSDLAKDEFEQIVASGVRRAIVQRGISARNVDVDITIDTGPALEELKEKDGVGLFEIMQLVEGGEISGEEGRERLNRLLQERGEETVDEDFQGAARSIPLSVVDALFEDGEE